jgi:hypothetical protein
MSKGNTGLATRSTSSFACGGRNLSGLPGKPWIEENMSRYKSERTEPKGSDPLQEFKALNAWLERDTRHSSRMRDTFEHPAFAEIVAMGPLALSFVLNEPLGWTEMELLSRLLGGRPEIPEEARGRLRMQQKIYREWVKKFGITYNGPDAT